MAARVGAWSARAAFVCSLVYVIAQLGEWMGWLGSAGGPHASSTALGIVVLLTPSLLLGPAFLMAMVGLHECTTAERRVWSLGALVFAVAYFVMISINYFVQLTWVGPRLAAGRTAGMEAFLFVPFDSFLYAVDILGYSLMSLATLLGGMVLEGRVKWLMVGNGCLLPFIALQMFWHELIWVAALWGVVFPWAMWELGGWFGGADFEAG